MSPELIQGKRICQPDENQSDDDYEEKKRDEEEADEIILPPPTLSSGNYINIKIKLSSY